MTRLFSLLLMLMLLAPAAQAGLITMPVGQVQSLSHSPAGPPCHDEGSKTGAPATVLHHECIGCIAPLDVAAYGPVHAPNLQPRSMDNPTHTPFPLNAHMAPEPPPPRFPA